uniref:Uncharacterized protein n=1 Tax=Anguilla anguilla TaxID=7936 RepID=A0A0E9WL91_ANGAN
MQSTSPDAQSPCWGRHTTCAAGAGRTQTQADQSNCQEDGDERDLSVLSTPNKHGSTHFTSLNNTTERHASAAVRYMQLEL